MERKSRGSPLAAARVGSPRASLLPPHSLDALTGSRLRLLSMSYAIFRAQGQQFKAEKGRTVRIPLMAGQPGTKVTFDEVLLSATDQKVHPGMPLVKGAKVTAEIVAHVKDRKLDVFKFKRRKNYRRKTGHRQRYTEIKITDVKVGS